jgi:diguanylate cyclase (GGDEF)-like protein
MVARGARLLAWLALPVGALIVLRAFGPLSTPSDPATVAGWLVPAACALAAIAGAVAAVLAVAEALRGDGSLARLFDAAGAGALASATGMVALQGPAASVGTPQAVIGLGLVASTAAVVVGGLVGPVGLDGNRARAAGVVGVFAWVEIPPLIGLFFGGDIAATTMALAAVGAALALVAMAGAVAAGAPERLGWTAGLASGAAALAAARTGTADVLPGILALAAAMVGMAAWLMLSEPPADAAPGPSPDEVVVPDNPPATKAEDGLETEILGLERELRGTIAELLEARKTITLQRAELEQLAETDPATRVASRQAILARLHNEAAEARRYEHPIALVLVDLDGLTGLNRSLGIGAGDVVLAELALRLRTRIREADAVGRITGDTFLAILPHTDERGAAVFADAIRTRLTARPVQTGAGPVEMTVSVGITVVRPGISDADDDELLGRAEEALSSARAAGGNRIAFDRSHGLARLDERRRDEPAGQQPRRRRADDAAGNARGEDERPA